MLQIHTFIFYCVMMGHPNVHGICLSVTCAADAIKNMARSRG